jgi:AmmeMemoRadiSam system protein B
MTRRPAVAGLFYPAGRAELARTVDGLLAPRPEPRLRGLVAPHAGYAYSASVAAAAFSLVPASARVALLAPSHFVPFEGLAVSSADAWETPLGTVAVAHDLGAAAVEAGAVVHDAPHARDHAIEVELPFLQRACTERLEILPVAVGVVPAARVADVIEAVAARGALVVVSTDLSHYRDEATARRLDAATAAAVLDREPAGLADAGACGVHALRGLVEHARRRDLQFELLDLSTSADVSGDRMRVVGYGAFALVAGEGRASGDRAARGG